MQPFEDILAANAAYVDRGSHPDRPVRPARQLAIVTCMDSRIDTFASLGLQIGDAHVIRVAGARVTPDVERSLALSTHALGTRRVAVIGHTDCGLRDSDGTLVARLAELMGHEPTSRDWYAFTDVEQAVREDCGHLRSWADRPEGFAVAGYVLDVETGRLEQVVAPAAAPKP